MSDFDPPEQVVGDDMGYRRPAGQRPPFNPVLALLVVLIALAALLLGR